MFGTCTSKDVGISSLLVTASENRMKKNLVLEEVKRSFYVSDFFVFVFMLKSKDSNFVSGDFCFTSNCFKNIHRPKMPYILLLKYGNLDIINSFHKTFQLFY